MSDIPGSNTVPLHKKRAGEHLLMAESLLQARSPWTHVAAFYSAYHAMKTALLLDPVFSSASQLAAASPQISMASRLANHHQGNESAGRAPGVNELVRYLYRPFYARYILLHGASITIRYGDGHLLHSPETCFEIAEDIHEAVSAGRIVHQPATG